MQTEEIPKEKKPIIKACMDCRRNHRKCDGQRPCSYCARRNLDCVDNQKRKNPGRPKKEEAKKCKKVCEKCNSKQEKNNKYCAECGHHLTESSLEAKNDELAKTNEILLKKNQELMRILEIRENLNPRMWVMSKIIFPTTGKFCHPLPSLILEISPSFQNMLGYSNLRNFYWPSLVPRKHVFEMDLNAKLNIRINKVDGMLEPKLICKKSDVFVKASNGKFVRLNIEGTTYFDQLTGLPSISMMFIEKILDVNVEEDSIPPITDCSPIDINFYCNIDQDLPSLIKKFFFMSISSSNDQNFSLTESQTKQENNIPTLPPLDNINLSPLDEFDSDYNDTSFSPQSLDVTNTSNTNENSIFSVSDPFLFDNNFDNENLFSIF